MSETVINLVNSAEATRGGYASSTGFGISTNSDSEPNLDKILESKNISRMNSGATIEFVRPDRPDYTNILDESLRNGTKYEKIKRILKVVRLELNAIPSYKIAIFTISLSRMAGIIFFFCI